LLIKYIEVVKPKSANGLVAQVYSQVKRDFGRIVEPFLVHSPLPELLAGAWMACRETELVGIVPRETKEALATTISKLNQCPYCVDAHTIMLEAAGEKQLAKNVAGSMLSDIQNGQAKAIVQWAISRSVPNVEWVKAPFSSIEAPEIIGTTVYFHYINRIANVLLSETPLPTNNPLLKGTMTRIAASMFSKALRAPKTAGDSLQFLPQTELPDDLAWAKPSPNVSGAFACFAKAVEIDGEYALPFEVRTLVQKEANNALSQKTEFTLNHVTQVSSGLGDDALESAAQLCLMTALMPSKITQKTMNTYRKHYPEDTKLLGALAWASFTATRKIGAEISKN
jgi:AhpD family alkylhydroperoxidase